MLLAVLTGVIGSLIFGLAGKQLLRISTFLPVIIPSSLFIYFASQLSSVNQSGSIYYHYSWINSLGINLDFHLDGLAILFALIITGIGTLVFFYAGYYMKKYDGKERFFSFLSLFMAAMIGLVLSDNIITLFIFWEMTSISSFFLIGFNHTDAASRKSALQALAITGLGGLFLLGFAILAYFNTDTMSIQEMLSSKNAFVDGNFSVLLMSLLFVAAFTKSAQFPFHFWLPGAMKAPTPVSTYLHSATMVKAGVYILLRFTPHFDGFEYWHTLLITFGAITMVYAAFHALFRTDMKSILAYSTIAALGVLVFLIGIGGEYAITTALLFILVHALYKAALFLITGIVDKQTGSRDVTVLSGLKKFMLPVALAGLVASLSSAGLPGTIGFIGKDLIYESTLHFQGGWLFLTILAVLTNILLIYAGFIVGIKPFFGKIKREETSVQSPSVLLWISPMILAFLSLLFGLAPFLADKLFINNAATGLGITNAPLLKIWHGFNIVLLLSLLTLAVGVILYILWKPNAKKQQFIRKFEKLSPQYLLLNFASIAEKVSYWLTRALQNGYLRNYVLVLVVVFIATVAAFFVSSPLKLWDFESRTPIAINDIIVITIMIIAIGFTIFSQSRLAAIAGLGIVGYAMCFIFVFFSAPDLAMTQFTIDTLTVILFVLVLYKLPRYLRLSNSVNRIRDGVLALIFGGLVTVLVLEVMMASRPGNVSQYYIDNAYVLAKGKNIVNVILVDFRGFDTLIEVVVLSIAAIGVYGLLKLHIKRNEK